MIASRISATEARQRVRKSQALLVCAYDDDAKCEQIKVDGSLPFSEFKRRASSLPKTQEIIFY